MSHFSGEYENRGNPGSPLPGGTTWPAEEGFHGPCTPEPPPGPQMPGHPATAAQRRDKEREREKQGDENDKSASELQHDKRSQKMSQCHLRNRESVSLQNTRFFFHQLNSAKDN